MPQEMVCKRNVVGQLTKHKVYTMYQDHTYLKGVYWYVVDDDGRLFKMKHATRYKYFKKVR